MCSSSQKQELCIREVVTTHVIINGPLPHAQTSAVTAQPKSRFAVNEIMFCDQNVWRFVPWGNLPGNKHKQLMGIEHLQE